MRKYLFLALAILAQNCATNKNLEAERNAKQTSLGHEFISGQWAETNDLARLKQRDLTPPHPFDAKATSHLTCFKEGKPCYDNWGTIYAFLEKKEDYYEYVSEDEELTLRFSVSEQDTTMAVEYKYQSNTQQQLLLSKVPGARTCDFKASPGDGITSGITVAYNYYYFKGKYTVKDLLNDSTVDVEISSDHDIFGLKDFDAYRLYTFGSNIRVELLKRPKDFRARIPKLQKCRLVATDYGFDLYAQPKASYIKTLEKLYEFRRK